MVQGNDQTVTKSKVVVLGALQRPCKGLFALLEGSFHLVLLQSQIKKGRGSELHFGTEVRVNPHYYTECAFFQGSARNTAVCDWALSPLDGSF